MGVTVYPPDRPRSQESSGGLCSHLVAKVRIEDILQNRPETESQPAQERTMPWLAAWAACATECSRNFRCTYPGDLQLPNFLGALVREPSSALKLGPLTSLSVLLSQWAVKGEGVAPPPGMPLCGSQSSAGCSGGLFSCFRWQSCSC